RAHDRRRARQADVDRAPIGCSPMALAERFQEILDSLPDDWTDMVLDLRLPDEAQYVDAATILTQINAQPYSKSDWHFRINVAHKFGKAAAAPAVRGTLALLDQEGIAGE